MDNRILFSFSNVTIRDNGETVFKDLDFSVKRCEHWALTGNADVLLQAIAGKKQVINGSTVKAQSVVLVGSTSQFKNLSNTGTFYHQQRFNSMDADDAQTVTQHLASIVPLGGNSYWKLQNALDKLNLSHLADKAIIKLSNGETRRLLLAEALLKNPALLLLDNPVAGLDITSRAAFNTLLQEVIASGIHIVVAVPEDEIPAAITHVAVIEGGNITSRQSIAGFKARGKANYVAFNGDLLKDLLNIQSDCQNIVSMKGVNIRYGDKVILDNIDWTVLPGERWAVLGHNGAGKSTLLSLINADNPQAYAVNISLFDKRKGTGESIWDIKKKIGYVSAELSKFFPPDQTCHQIIESGFYDTMGLFRKPASANAEIIKNWMDALEISAYADKIFARVPDNVKQLCLLARAMVKNPPLLILDEPCTGMDATQKLYFKTIINHICTTSNLTLIFVSHYPEEIPACVNRTLVLQNGSVVQAQ
ncbi:MAG: ATP-binding cassette domain-containing protein [Sphingobacteriales bacterium]|nr:MAG: ATP-binding cassette domain-containing protein [Sphingobacteriales bacterium]